MKTHTIKEINQLLIGIKEEDPLIEELAKDSRKGVQLLLKRWKREKRMEQEEFERFQKMTIYEQLARKEGYTNIAGIDEAGRGPLAGPVVSAAVILRENSYIEGLNDSKKVNGKKRIEIYKQIREEALSVSVGVVSAEEIDRLNIYESARKSMLSAVQGLSIQPDYLLVDAMVLHTPFPEKSIVKGDANSVSIAAASIIAKVTRDRMMEEYDLEFPGYGFSEHMGYGTKNHLTALQKLGACPIHRKTFGPVKNVLK